MDTKFLNTRYTLMQTSYWGIFCALNGYAALYLDGKGFSAGQTGTLLAAGNILAAFLQPMVAAKADRPGRLSLKELIVTLGLISALAAALLCVTKNDFWIVSILFCISVVTNQILQPLANAVSMYYMNRGEKINFGFARGIGSVAYAGVSYLIGMLAGQVGVIVIPVAVIALYAVFLVMAFSFRIRKKGEESEGSEEKNTKGFVQLFAEHKTFAVFLAGIVVMFIFHFMTNTYMFQMVQAVGGDSRSMGIAVSIAAVCEIPVMIFFSKLVERIRVETLLRIAGIGWLVKAVAFCFCTSVAGIYATQVLQILAFGIYVPASVYYANQTMDESSKVKGQAMVTTAFTVGSVIGNLLGGKLIDWYGVHVMLTVGAVCTGVGAVLFFLGTRKDTE